MDNWIIEQAEISYQRLWPRLSALLPKETQAEFERRLRHHFLAFFSYFFELYGDRYDFFYHLEQVLATTAQGFSERWPSLKQLDLEREQTPDWFQSEHMLGAVCYVDRFAGDLHGIRERIPYFRELGLTYLHLMPLFRCPAHNNDGGYAISSFREVDPRIGTMQELAELAQLLREQGISLVIDFVFNHTSDEHEWAQHALKGVKEYQDYYWMFPDRTLPDQYEPYLREIFPEQAPGSFTYRPEIDRWVWTTFYPFQWDLNYRNPAVFRAMLAEMLFLANQGIQVLRLDAVPFIWKQLGTPCENLPQVHTIIRAYNLLAKIAAPALVFKSEAIVHPRDVRSYVSWEECPLSYNPILMVAIWEALATRSIRFFTHTMRKQFPLEGNTAWVNYLRSHDDIGWGFADEDAAEVGINGFDHRYFLNQFYTGRFPGSFARGQPFNYNPRTQDMRISGTLASLMGLEQALELDDPLYLEHALRRIALGFSIILSIGGIPLIFLGDEIGTLNDYTYTQRPAERDDSRWLHRPFASRERYQRRHQAGTPEARIFADFQRMVKVRKSTPALANGRTQFLETGSYSILGYLRNEEILVLANFSDYPQTIASDALRNLWPGRQTEAVDLLTRRTVSFLSPLVLEPFVSLWLQGMD
jgi:amylosucrase